MPTPIVFVGHVDHGKSTLIGRLLHDTGNLQDGRFEAAVASSARRGHSMEWSFLLDSLQAERDQGVTIDATRLPFALDGRPFAIVDAPGHRQFLRNMVTAAADAAAAVLVVDAAEGGREQTRRHAVMLRTMGVRHVIALMNKADLLDYDRARVEAATTTLRTLLEALGIHPVALIPASARHGDNVARRAAALGWYDGPTLVEALASVPRRVPRDDAPFRLPVQDVYRRGDRRLVVGRVESGRLAVGDAVVVGPARTAARVVAFEAWSALSRPLAAASGQSVALELAPDIVVDRGDVIVRPDEKPLVRASRVRAGVFWLRAEGLVRGENLRLRLATAEYDVTVAAIERVVAIDDGSGPAARDQVPPEGFAEVTLSAGSAILFDPFEPGGGGGRGVLVDAHGRIVGGAPLLAPVAISADRAIHPVHSAVTASERARRRGHAGGVFWLTGLPGSGKSTLAHAAERLLFDRGRDVAVLDGDTLRSRLNGDLGFGDADRTENIRRTAAVARLMAEAGLAVLVALISPRASQRALARAMVGDAFREVFVDAEAAICERRDPKGHWEAARAGRLPSFTGIGDGYEVPGAPDLLVDTTTATVEAAAERLALFVEATTALSAAGTPLLRDRPGVATTPTPPLRDEPAAANGEPPRE